MLAARSLIVATVVASSGLMLFGTGCPFAMGDDYVIVSDGGAVAPVVTGDVDAATVLSCPDCDLQCNTCVDGACKPSPTACEMDGCGGKGCKP
jgi:hypothetical protein